MTPLWWQPLKPDPPVRHALPVTLPCPTTAVRLFFALAASCASLAPAPGIQWVKGVDRATAAIRPLTSHALPVPNSTRNPTWKSLSLHSPCTKMKDCCANSPASMVAMWEKQGASWDVHKFQTIFWVVIWLICVLLVRNYIYIILVSFCLWFTVPLFVFSVLQCLVHISVFYL